EGFSRPSPLTTAFRDQFALLDQNNNPIPCPPGSGNTCDTTPFGTLDRTATRTTTVGASLQATSTGQLFEHDNHLVFGGSFRSEGFSRPSPLTTAFRDQFALLDQNNNPIPCPPGSGNTCDTTPFGTLDRTATRTTTVGASLQATSTGQLFEHDNHLVFGGSI